MFDHSHVGSCDRQSSFMARMRSTLLLKPSYFGLSSMNNESDANRKHAQEDPYHRQSASKLMIEILTLAGQTLQCIHADPAWRRVHVLAMLKKTGALAPDVGAQILHGANILTNSNNLAAIGASNGSQLTVVFTKPSYILTACLDFQAKLWDPMTGICVLTLQGHKAPIKSAVFSPDAHQVLTHSFDGTAKLWFVDSGECLFTFQPSVVNVFIAAFSPDGLQVLTTDSRTQMSLWCSWSGVLLKRFGRCGDQILIASFSPNGQQVLEVSFDQTPRLWCVDSGVLLRSFTGHNGRVNSAIFSADAQCLLTASADFTAKLWSVASCKCLHTFAAHAADVICAAFSEDGEKILTADVGFVIKVWSTKSWQCQLTIERGEWRLSLKSAVFSSNSRKVLTTSDDGKTQVWCTKTGKCLCTFEDPDGAVTDAAFFSDGQQVLTASSYKIAKLWSVVSGEYLLTLFHKWSVTCVAVTPKTDAIGNRKRTDNAEEPPCKRRKSTQSTSLALNSSVCISPWGIFACILCRLRCRRWHGCSFELFFWSIFSASHSEFRLSKARYEFREYYVLSCVTLAL